MPGGRVTLDPSYGYGVQCLVMAAPERGGGVGGWQASERASQRPGKWFKAQPDDTYSWDLAIDQDVLVTETPVEERLARIRKMGVRHSGNDEPPTIKLDGDVWDDDEGLTWVMEDFTLGDRLYNGAGKLQRQHFTVTLSRFDAIDEVEAVRITRTRGKGRKRRHHVVKARAGDTLRSIALRELGSGSRWKELKAWNKKKFAHVNPDARIRAGVHLRVH